MCLHSAGTHTCTVCTHTNVRAHMHAHTDTIYCSMTSTTHSLNVMFNVDPLVIFQAIKHWHVQALDRRDESTDDGGCYMFPCSQWLIYFIQIFFQNISWLVLFLKPGKRNRLRFKRFWVWLSLQTKLNVPLWNCVKKRHYYYYYYFLK